MNKPKARKDNVVIQKVNDEILIFDLKRNTAICLNQTANLVWQNCTGQKDYNEIANILSRKTKSRVEREIVELAVEQLKDEDLLEDNEDLTTSLVGISRRDAIRQIGFSAAICLPVVASIAAPTAVHAQSCLPNGTLRTCSNDPANDPNCSEVLPGLFRCTASECCTGFCAIQPPNVTGNCAN